MSLVNFMAICLKAVETLYSKPHVKLILKAVSLMAKISDLFNAKPAALGFILARKWTLHTTVPAVVS